MPFSPVKLVLAVLCLAAGRVSGAPLHDAQAAERGRALLWQYQCGTCHAIPGVAGSRGQVAAPLAGWRGRSYIAGRLPNQPDLLARWIVAPDALVPGTAMPRMGVSPEEAAAMAAYLDTLE